ncbi:MAG: alginate export family protein [Gemmataceae bacterium]|nr:alginate export family protein [Gemmataceae bacterium]
MPRTWWCRAAAKGLVVGVVLTRGTVAWAQQEQPGPTISAPVATAEAGAAPNPGTTPEAGAPTPHSEAPKEPECKNPWAKVPPVRPLTRTGPFPMPPTGPGYYSLSDHVHHAYREKPPQYGYPPVALVQSSSFDLDFRYLEDPKHTSHDWFDPLKRVHLGCDWLFSTGGQTSWRHMNEVNSRLLNVDNTYDLFRARTYMDLWYQDQFRVFAEFIYAETFNQDLPPLVIDGTRADLLNLFVDVKVGDIHDQPAYVRVGRQELLFGSQRLISTLEWANTRRTFQGVRVLHQTEKFDVDLFWVQPVIPNRPRFDSVDNNQNFAGLWTTYKPKKGINFDTYYLFLDNTNQRRQLGLDVAPFNVHTLGTRYAGDQNNWLWDIETALQLGERGSQHTVAGIATVGSGYHFAQQPLNPSFWVFYDWASGDHSPGTGSSYHTFNQLFPFGHFYLGWVDQVGRQNIQDLNAHVFFYPTNWITVWLQYHHFWLDSSRDALYNAAGAAIRRDPTGRAGHNVGDEIDLVLNFHLGTHHDVLVGYSKLFAGSFLERSGPAVSPELFYAQYSFRW